MPGLSKSKYTKFCQCDKALWLKMYKPELEEVDDATKRRFEQGNEVGDLAMGLFGNYKEAHAEKADGRLDLVAMTEQTRQWMAEGVENICEASFICENHLVCLSNDGHATAYPLFSTADSVKFDLDCVKFAPHCNVANLVRKGKKNYLYTSEYGNEAQYLGYSAKKPIRMQLNTLKWEIVNSMNLGFDLGFLNDRITSSFEVYRSKTSDMLMDNYRIPSENGFSSLTTTNVGDMSNLGWEIQINTNRLIKTGKFVMDMNFNFGNNRNEILKMDEIWLRATNSTFNNENRQSLTRIQLHNPFGSIYGFRSKGVYQYEYETVAAMTQDEQKEFFASGKTAPVARDVNGNVIYNEKGEPLRMMFAYTNDGTGRNYTFRGGDAIYEDVNHDGQINALDIVYIGSSLPISTQFTYRVGNKILNLARLDAEAMINNDNQSQAVNYRWRKEGDVTTIPRAMHGETSNYNTLISDRFVEDGSYLRMGYANLSYALKSDFLKNHLHISKMSFNLSANNPFILTKYTGVDPDISSSGYGPATDRAQTPRAKYFTVGTTINF